MTALRNASITTINARKGLKPHARPYFREISAGVSLGYRKKTPSSGVWVLSLYLGGKSYKEKVLAAADDAVEADGHQALTYEQARRRAIETAERWRTEIKAKASGPVVTVGSAVRDYIASMLAREKSQGRTKKDAQSRLTWHVMNDPIAGVALHALTERALLDWRARRAASLCEATKRRISNDLRAALNAAHKHNRQNLPLDLPSIIKHGLASLNHDQPIARDGAALSDDEVRAVLDAAAAVDAEAGFEHDDLHRLIIVLAATGARWSQVVRVKVGDLIPEKRKIMVPVSRKGKGTKARSHIATPVGEDVIDALAFAAMGRPASEPLLQRWLNRPSEEGFAQWRREGRGPWHNSSEITRPWAAILAKAGLPSDTVPYALRHSAIVRMLRAGLPVRVVAELVDSSAAIIEKHYGAAIASKMDDLVASAVVPLVGARKSA